MSGDRVFDPAAVEEFRQFLQDLLDRLETEVVPELDEGALRRAPAFGSAPGAAGALERYLAFRAAVWRNLQHLRGSLHGLAGALAETVAAESETSAEIDSMFDGFDGFDGPA